MKRFALYICCLLLTAACSTTKNLPEGEILYTGQKAMIVENPPTTPVGETAMEEVEAALATAPNNSLLGSSSVRIPFPFGLWVYNGFVKYEKGVGRWIFNRFAAKPVLMSTVNPDIRQKAAQNILRDYGYFNGTVSYQTFTDPKDSLKAKLQYTVNMNNPYVIDTVFYQGFSQRTLRIMEMSRRRSLISPGEQFNITDLDGERTRISNLLRNIGCYYFRPDYLTYQADTTLVPGGHVSMRMIPVAGMPKVAEKPFYVGRKAIYLYGRQGEEPNDSTSYNGVKIYYHDKLDVRPNMLYRWMNYQGFRMKRQVTDSAGISRQKSFQNRYSLYRQTRIQERLSNVGIFRYLEMQYVPRDTAMTIDTLDVNVRAMLNKPYDAELDFNVKLKSNNQMGPGAAFTVTKNNVFGGGESWNIKLNGSYEWQTGNRVAGNSSAINSWELGISGTLTFPQILFTKLFREDPQYPSSTSFRIYADQLNRAKFFKMLAFGGSASYEYQTSATSHHSITPFKLTYSLLQRTTAEFDSIVGVNKALGRSLENQFIPAMSYTYTYDDSPLKQKRHHLWWQTSFTQAGLLVNSISTAMGNRFNERDKNLFGIMPGLNKSPMHLRHPSREDFAAFITSLFSLAKVSYAFIDGIIAMEGAGPANGTLRHLGLLLGGADAYLVDKAQAIIMGYDWRDIPVLAAAQEKGHSMEGEVYSILDAHKLTVADFQKIDVDKPRGLFSSLILPFFTRGLKRRKEKMRPAPRFDDAKCVHCLRCMKICPAKALSHSDRIEIDTHKCIRCYCCAEMCPADAIEVEG